MGNVNQRETQQYFENYGSANIDYSDKTYKISYEALTKFILTIIANGEITVQNSTKTYSHLIFIKVDNCENCGGCFYDFKDREAYGMTENWATLLDHILEEKINESVGMFSEEAYNAEKSCDGITKAMWTTNMMSD